jgi:probable HAF family extracellular repeat protein
MQSLGTLGSNDSCGMGVNSSGQVAGYSNTSAGYTHPFLWDKVDGMRDLGTLEGREDAVYYAYAINDPGQVVGGASGVAFRWDNENGMRTVGSLIDARDVNNSGQIAGSYYMGGQHAVLWDEVSGERDLGTLGGASTASGLNDMGQVVGYSLISGGGWGSPTIYHAFLWDEVNGMQDIGTLGGAQSVAQGINNLGQVVGYSTTPDGVYHAFVWDSVNGMQNLTPENGGFAFAINDLGTIVGEAYFDGALKPTIWEAPAAPEPVSSALFIIGGGALAAMRRRKK